MMKGMEGTAANNGGAGEQKAQSMYRLEFRLSQPGGSSKSGEGDAFFTGDILSVMSCSGSEFSFSVREIDSFEAADYRINVRLQSGANLELFALAYKYEDFVRLLTVTRNEYIKQDLLFHEKLLFTAESIRFDYYESNKASASGDCDAQVSETALVLADPAGNHLRFPLSYAERIFEEDYAIKIFMETGDRVILSMLGRQREALLLKLEQAVSELEKRAGLLCRDLFPDADDALIRKLSILFKDGRAVPKAALDSLSPELWETMENRLSAYGIKESCDYLKQTGDIDLAAIGFKRGLMGDLTGEYVWFLIPVMGSGGRFVAMEAGSGEGTGGRATYFYSMPGGSGGNRAADQEFIRLVNYSLLMVNFRREPVYLSEEMLQKPAYSQYKYAIERLPALRLLRSLFAGRVVHSSEEYWRNGVARILGKA